MTSRENVAEKNLYKMSFNPNLVGLFKGSDPPSRLGQREAIPKCRTHLWGPYNDDRDRLS